MASFTDKIPTFNPYVAQLPVEAMVEVGMQKQKQYDEGITKIQSNIDAIGGLDIAKEKGRAYLQSKINELGNDLKGFMASDFSNFQLVNSVNGMTGQIVKDPIIQNAVSSTAKIRKEQGRMEEAKKSGKSAVENEWIFNYGVNDYLRDDDLKSSYNGEYIEYTDVDKKLRDLASKLKESDVSIDNPFLRDGQGRTIYYNSDGTQSSDASKGGEPRLDRMMLNTKVKGIGAKKILNNFYDSLSETEMRQLNITAQYHYKDSNYGTFQQDIIKTYNEKREIFSEAIVDATLKLNNPKTSPEEKKNLENEINEANNYLASNGGLDQEMAKDLEKIDSVGEEANYKYKIYTQKYLTNLAKDLDNESKSIEFKTNPGWQAYMEVKKFEFDVAKERQREREAAASHSLAIRSSNREDARFNMEVEKYNRELNKNKPIVKDNKITTNVKKETLGDIDVKADAFEADVNKGLQDLAKILVPNAKTPEQKARALTIAKKYYQDYKTDPTQIDDNKKREMVEKIEADSKQYNFYSKMWKSAKDAGSGFEKQIADVYKTLPGVKIKNQNISAMELSDFEDSANKFIHRYNVRDGEGGFITREKMSEELLTRYKGTKYYPIAVALRNEFNNNSLSDNEKVIINVIKKIRKVSSGEVAQLNLQKQTAQQKTILDLSPQYQTKIIELSRKNDDDMNIVNQIIGIKTKDFQTFGSLDSANPDDFDPETVEGIRTDKNRSYSYEKNYDGSATLLITGTSGTQKIPLTREEFNNWVPKYSYINPITELKYSINSSKAKTTNDADKVDGATAGISGYSNLLPGINNTKLATRVRADVEGSKNNNGGSNDKFQVRLYYYNNNKVWDNKILNNGGYVNELELQELLTLIGPGTVNTLFK
jgi:osmotically-inducible protein OsmY